jgi:glycosyltransferase involved in cell wall biosynthesis
MTMRILALTNLYPNPYQPHRATFNRQHLRLLAADHAVAVIAPILWTDELALRRGRARLAANRRVTFDGITVYHPSYIYPPKVLRNLYGHFFRESVRHTFERAVAAFRPDLIYTPWAYPDGWAAVELGRRAGLPVVIKVHGSDVLGLDTYPGRRARTLEALTGADRVIAVSRDLAARVIGLGADPARVRVIYDGVDAARFCPGPRGEARERLGLAASGPVVLFVGNLVPVKGAEVLIDACACLARGGLHVRCYLVGLGPLRAALERRVRLQGLERLVTLIGPVPHDRLPDWYRSADAFVLPSYSEGVPNVLLEAAACGIPFVASRVGGIPEVAAAAASRLVPPGNTELLAREIRQTLEGAGRNGEPHRPAAGGVRDYADTVADLASLFEECVAPTGLQPAPTAAATAAA